MAQCLSRASCYLFTAAECECRLLLNAAEGGLQTMDEVLAVNVSEAARRLGVSPRTVATLVAEKKLLSRRIGRRRVILVHALEKFLRQDHPSSKCKI